MSEIVLSMDGVEYPVKYRVIYGGLVSAALMAVVNKAQTKINNARGLNKLLDLIAPYTQVNGDSTTIKEATDAAVKAGAIPLSDALRVSRSDDELEATDGEYFAAVIGAYCDILAACLDFTAMSMPKAYTADELANLLDADTIKKVATDFLLIAKPKPTPSDSSEHSDASQVTTETTKKKEKVPKPLAN